MSSPRIARKVQGQPSPPLASNVVEELRYWFDAGQEDVATGESASTVEQMTFGAVDILEVGVIDD